MRKPSLILGVSVGAALVVLAAPARADRSIIKHPGRHPPYHFEIEPHALLGFGGPLGGPFERGHAELGAGARATITIVKNGFVRSINNSVGIGFGADFYFDRDFKNDVIHVPVAMQWNFWLTRRWSVFGEPGVGFHVRPRGGRGDLLGPILMAGGRFHFTRRVALTMRIGYPSVSVGLSLLL